MAGMQRGAGMMVRKIVGNKFAVARGAVWLPLAAVVLSASGCTGGPTYGTGVGSETQLMSDVSNILSIAPKPKPSIAYKPRPELVRPAAVGQGSLPAPQQKVATAGNPEWPESPEERRARIRAEATANQNNSSYESEVIADGTAAGGSTFVPPVDRSPHAGEGHYESGKLRSYNDAKRQREAFNKKLAETRQGDQKVRRYLSDPPLAYRQAADTAPQNDVGEDEWKKEQRLKAEAKAKSGKKAGWFDWVPGI